MENKNNVNNTDSSEGNRLNSSGQNKSKQMDNKTNQGKANKQDGEFKSLKYSNEIQSIFPMKPINNTWEEDLKNKYKLVEDSDWDKGFEVWRTLPMQSELEQKLSLRYITPRRTADFTKQSKPEAYLPGFSSRKTGPINRPHQIKPVPIRRHVVQAVPIKTKEETEVSEEGLPTSRRESGGMLQDGIVKHKI